MCSRVYPQRNRELSRRRGGGGAAEVPAQVGRRVLAGRTVTREQRHYVLPGRRVTHGKHGPRRGREPRNPGQRAGVGRVRPTHHRDLERAGHGRLAHGGRPTDEAGMLSRQRSHGTQRRLGRRPVPVRAGVRRVAQQRAGGGRASGRRGVVGAVLRAPEKGLGVVRGVVEAAAAVTEVPEYDVEQVTGQPQPVRVAGDGVERKEALGDVTIVVQYAGVGADPTVPGRPPQPAVHQMHPDQQPGRPLGRPQQVVPVEQSGGIRQGGDGQAVPGGHHLVVAGRPDPLLADAAGLFDRDDLLRAAERAAGLLVRVHLVDGRLWRTSRDGRVGPSAGVLDDYGDVAEGFLALYAVTGNPHWLRLTGDLLDVVLGHFDDGRGGFYDTADDAETLLRRPQDGTDNATPSGSAAAAGALLSYAAYTGSHRHRAAAEAALGAVAPLARQHARFIGWAAAVGEAAVAGPLEIAVVGRPNAADTCALARVARLTPSPGAVLAVGDPAAGQDIVPLLAGHPRHCL